MSIIQRSIRSQWENCIQEGEVDQRLVHRWMPKFRLEVMDDPAKYKDMPTTEIQKHFREWAISDFDAIVQIPDDELPCDSYDPVYGPYDRDERFKDAEFPGRTEEEREQNRKFSLSNKGALHQACLMVDGKSIESIIEAEECGRSGHVKIVDVYALGEGIENGYTEISVNSLGSGWASITHEGSLKEYVHF